MRRRRPAGDRAVHRGATCQQRVGEHSRELPREMHAVPIPPIPQRARDNSPTIGLSSSTILVQTVLHRTRQAPLSHQGLLHTHTVKTDRHRRTKTPCPSAPGLSGRTVLRPLAHHDDQLTALGVQVLQAEGGVGDNHG